jgi:hypothetical protein
MEGGDVNLQEYYHYWMQCLLAIGDVPQHLKDIMHNISLSSVRIPFSLLFESPSETRSVIKLPISFLKRSFFPLSLRGAFHSKLLSNTHREETQGKHAVCRHFFNLLLTLNLSCLFALCFMKAETPLIFSRPFLLDRTEKYAILPPK